MSSEEVKQRTEKFKENSLLALKSFAEMGVVKEVVLFSSPRDSVCAHCKAQVGKIVKLEDAVVGVNIPPYDECRNEEMGCCCGFKPTPRKKKIDWSI